jgi:hypothetical protein
MGSAVLGRVAAATVFLVGGLEAQGGWLSSRAFVGGVQASLAYDGHRGVLVAYLGAASRRHELWERRLGRWIERDLPPMPSQFGAAAEIVYDAWRRRLVLLRHVGSQVETWESDGRSWALRDNAALGACALSAVYEPHRQRTVALVWARNGVAAGETWEWDGGAWQQAAALPQPRLSPAIAFDPVLLRVVLFGGLGHTSELGDTWLYDGAAWTQSASAGPAARAGASMAFDAGNARLLLHGGTAIGQPLDDAWYFDGTWQLATASASARDGGELVDEGARVAMLGFDDRQRLGLMDWNGALFAPAGERSALSFYEKAAAIAPGGGVLTFGGAVWFGASAATGQETMHWDGLAWRGIATSTAPTPRQYTAMALDLVRSRVVLFGGSGSFGGMLADTWEFDGVDWSQRPVAGPPARALAGMAYSVQAGRVVLFGGHGNTGALGDTWQWDGANWVQLGPPAGPSARSGASMAMDPGSGLVWLHGGSSVSTPNLDDTWTYDGRFWTCIDTGSGTHGGRIGWDPRSGRVVLLADTNSSVRALEWNAGWQPIAAPEFGTPHALVPDLGRGRVVGLADENLVLELSPGPLPEVIDLGFACASGAPARLCIRGRAQLGGLIELDVLADAPAFAAVAFAHRRGDRAYGSCTLVPELGEYTWFGAMPLGATSAGVYVPDRLALLGCRLFVQAVLPDAAAPSGMGVGGTNAVELRVGY